MCEYFDKEGIENTQAVLTAARKRAEDLRINNVIFASTHGYTAKMAAQIFKDSNIKLIAVGLSHACKEEGWVMTCEEREKIESLGIKVLVCQHGLSRGVAEAFENNVSTAEIIAQTYYTFGQGMKVAVEISLMAAEAGLLKENEKIISIAGSNDGADTAILMTPSYAWKFRNIKIHEILCKPGMY